LSRAKKTYMGWQRREWEKSNIAKVHGGVNEIKHASTGTFWGRPVDELEATAAARELITLLEAWSGQP
jgi:hypothetical protein